MEIEKFNLEQLDDNDSVILLIGPAGSGKSVLRHEIINNINPNNDLVILFCDNKYDMIEERCPYIASDYTCFEERVNTILDHNRKMFDYKLKNQKKSYVVVDDACSVLNKPEFIDLITSAHTLNIRVIMCCQFLPKLDSKIINSIDCVFLGRHTLIYHGYSDRIYRYFFRHLFDEPTIKAIAKFKAIAKKYTQDHSFLILKNNKLYHYKSDINRTKNSEIPEWYRKLYEKITQVNLLNT